METLIIGNGEVGKALYSVLGKTYSVRMLEEETNLSGFDYLHICFPYDDIFDSEVRYYQKKYKPRITVMHSTVPVGTSDKLGACHSPVMGIHPFLEESLMTFTKFVGGKDADEVAEYFRKAGMKVHICRDSRTTELGKLADTMYYGVCIEFAKEIDNLCRKHNVPFSESYTLFNQVYNEGYSVLGRYEYIRPILEPIQQKIGGHCVIPNLYLLKSKFADFIKSLN
jgi:hypothetical protein